MPASYTSQYLYRLSYDSDAGKFKILSLWFDTPITVVDPDDDNTLSGTLNYNGDGPDIEYLGHTNDGWLGQDDFYGYLFHTNTAYQQGDFLDISTEPFVVCFMAGTRIATPLGERVVEALTLGDEVLTASGETRAIRWIGRQRVTAFFADRQRSGPIRIAAGALGEGLPRRDLLVSPDHALLVDGLLVQAGALVNGSSIRREADLPETFTYFHVELEDHALILAEGVPAETFVDNVTRRRFDNYADYVALHGEASAATGELAVPRVKSPRQLPPRTAGRLQRRALEMGLCRAQAA
ncbi:Hint domain-containing protein [Roseomonas sp. 18066]|uniref:Hint domain-containing protein n=1 Tax=Roseomonas sp. 18066 TaxID=2681412 RepID=UPI001356D499|nr:Hint domain-containing protein [Roseomonas sp. 18066]